MLNKYPLWKYLLVLIVIITGALYAAPNLYAPDPALQIAGDICVYTNQNIVIEEL